MSTTLTRWRDSAFAPFDWAGLLPLLTQEIRVEQYVDDGHYVLRAELAGFDPEQEIELTVTAGVLRIEAERAEAMPEHAHHYRAHSEFRYGRFVRSIVLPSTIKPETGHATYRNGVLEVTFAVGEPKPAGRRIAIKTAMATHDDDATDTYPTEKHSSDKYSAEKYPTEKYPDDKYPGETHPTGKQHFLAKQASARPAGTKPGGKTVTAKAM
jgi:HSP20 family molecular chaperone IbpA